MRPRYYGSAEQIKAKSFTIDGEAVVLGPDGLSRFEELRSRAAAGGSRPALMRCASGVPDHSASPRSDVGKSYRRSAASLCRLSIALALSPSLCSAAAQNRRQSHGPVMGVADIKPHRGAITADDHPVTVMLDFVTQSAPEGDFDALTGCAGITNRRKRLDFHCPEKIGPTRCP
jgi:hypothetical protein